jgi:diguanylate cyclase
MMSAKQLPTPQINDKKAARCAQQALEFMLQNNVPPTPEHYTVWYAFAYGEHQGITEEISHLIDTGATFTPQIHEHLRQRYLTTEDQAKHAEVQQAATEIQHSLEEVLSALGDSSSRTSDYGRDLAQFVENIPTKGASPELLRAIEHIVHKTMELKQNSEQLSARLESSCQEIAELKTNLEKVSTEAQTDALTGVGNRKVFEESVRRMTAEAIENGNELCLLMVDIDHFKQVNDTHGHQMGDAILKVVAGVLKDSVKGRDIVARYGGEEFAVLLPRTPIGGAMILAENLRAAVAGKLLRRKDTQQVIGSVTVSIGVSAYGRAEDSREAWIKRADDALYHAKKNGRNRVAQQFKDE